MTTGITWLDQALQIAGAVYCILSTLALILPAEWAFTKFVARFAADLKKVLPAQQTAKPEAPRIPPGTMLLLVVALVMAPQATGCAWLKANDKTIQDVITAVQDGAQVLEVIRSIANAHFLAHPNPEAQAKVERVMADAETALDAGIRIARGVTDLSKEQADAAFTDFRTAYGQLVGLLRDLGAVDGDSGKLGAARVRIPVPIAMGRVSQ